MIESYRVGAIFELRDEVSPKLRGIFENVERLEKAVGRVQKAFSSINQVALGGFTEKLQGIGEKLSTIGTKAEGIGSKMRSGLQSADAAIVESGRKLEGFSGRFSAIETASRTAGEAVTGNIGRATTAVGDATAAVGRMNEALRLAGESSRGIARIPRMGGGGSGGGGEHPRPGQGGSGGHARNTYGAHGAYVDAGMLGMIGGHEVAEAVERSLHRGMELAHVQQQMGQAGIAQSDIDRATTGAWKEARTYGLDVSKVLGDIKELVLPFGSVGHAIEFIEPLEKMRVVLNAVSEGRGNESSEAVYKMARAGELKGLNNAEDYLRYFDGMTKAISASGGKVTPNGFAQVTQYGKLASQGWSEDFYTKSLPTLMQTMNPSTAGQSLMSLFNTLESGAVSKRSFGQMSDLGLIGDESKVEYENGKYKGMRPGAIIGSDLLAQNPLEWSRQFLTPLLEKKFGDLSDDKNKLNAIENLGGLFGNRNSAAAIAELALRVKSFDRDKGLIDQAHGINGADALLKNDPTTAMNNFTAAWTNMLTAFGLSSVSTAVGAMNTLSGVMNRLGEMAQAHPDALKNVEGALAGLAVGLGALALVGLAVFAPQGMAIVAMTSLGSALAGLIAVHWDQVEAAAKSMGLSMDNFHRHIAEMEQAFSQIDTALTKFFTGIVNTMRAIPGLGRLIPGGPNTEAFGPPMPPGMQSPSGIDPFTPGFLPMAYHSNDNGAGSPMVDMLAMGVFKGLQMYAAGGGAAGGLGGGSGIINASYGGGGFSGGAGSSPLLRGAGMGGGFHGSGGANPYVGGSGGGTFVPPVGDHLTAGMRNNNLGNIGWFGQHMAGLLGPSNAHDVDHSIGRFATQEDGIRAAAALALSKYHKGRHSTWDIIAAAGGWTPGALGPGASVNVARAMGLGNRDDVHLDDPDQMVKFLHGLAVQEHGPAGRFYSEDRIRSALGHHGMPTVTGSSRKVAPGAPAAAATQAVNMPPIHAHIFLGGKKIHHEVVRQFAQAGRFPTSGGGPDMHSHYSNAAGTPITDAA